MDTAKDTVTMINDLPHGVIVHDMAFDWAGKRIAIACSDKTIKVYLKGKELWEEESLIKAQGASVWKLKWARPEYGIVLVACTLDRQLRMYEWTKMGTNKNDWWLLSSSHRRPEDLKFAPGVSFGLTFGIVTSEGRLEIHQFPSGKTGNPTITSLDISKYGLSCLSWSKGNQNNQAIIAIGEKEGQMSLERAYQKKIRPEEPLEAVETISFAHIKTVENTIQLQKIPVPSLKQRSSVSDVSWAFLNGRSYHLLAASTDVNTVVYEVSITNDQSQKSISILKSYTLSNFQGFRLSWNLLGTYLCITQEKKVKIYRALTRGNWQHQKDIES